MAPRNHAACVGSYCEAILSGEIIAGRYVELAVRRYLDDLEHAHELLGFFSSSDSTGGSGYREDRRDRERTAHLADQGSDMVRGWRQR
jgi:hypothetical protein